jgi:hypothetical protein
MGEPGRPGVTGSYVALGLWCAFEVAAVVLLVVLGRFVTAAIVGGVGVLLTLLHAYTLSWMGRETAAEPDPDAWRPPGDDRRPTARFDLDIETERLWDYGTRGWLLSVLLGAVVVAAVTAAGALPSAERVPRGGGGVALGLALACVVAGILACADAAIEWRKRHAAVVADGWRPAQALVFLPSGRADNGKISVRYRDHSRILLDRRPSTHLVSRRARTGPQDVWIGGAGRFMVLLFPPDDSDPWPYAVPVVARAPRVR